MDGEYPGKGYPIPCKILPGLYHTDGAGHLWEQKGRAAQARGLCNIYGKPEGKARDDIVCRRVFPGRGVRHRCGCAYGL